MAVATTLKIIAEKYYSKLWIGNGTAPDALDMTDLDTAGLFNPQTANYFHDPIAMTHLKYKDANNEYQTVSAPLPVTPKVGWFYIDATTGNFYIFNGASWGSSIGKWTGGFL